MFVFSGSHNLNLGMVTVGTPQGTSGGISPEVSPQSYILSLMEDLDEDEEDLRIHTASANGDADHLKLLLRDEEMVKRWINYRIRPYLAPPLRVAVTGMII